MKILIDESLPRKLKAELTDLEVSTVQELGWAGKKNGELLQLMAGNFDVFLTVDQNLKYQQNLSKVRIAIIVLRGPNKRLETLKPLMVQVRKVLTTIQSGEVIEIEGR